MNRKAVHLTSVHPANDTRIFHKECVSLAKAGYDVVLVAPDALEGNHKGVRVRSVRKSGQRLSRILNTTISVLRVGLEENADFYHIHDPELLPWAHLLRLRGKTVIYDMHENLPSALSSKPWIPKPLRQPISDAFGLLERVFLRGLPVIFAEDSYDRLYPWIKKSTVVLNLPETESLLSVQEEKFENYSVGYMGAVSANRGSLTTLAALRLLQRQEIHVEFQCIGPMSEAHKQELKKRVYTYGLCDVTFHGRLAQEVGWRIMARCHAGLAALKRVPNYADSYPTKMFEYMALGLPIIVSDFPLYKEIVSTYNCGICVDPSSPKEISNAIRFLMDHPAKARRMGESGQQAIMERLSWSTEEEKLLDFYRSLVEDR